MGVVLDYKAQDVMDEAADVYLNDGSHQFWDYTTMMRKLKAAHRDMQLALDNHNIDVVRKTSTIVTITSGMTTMGTGNPPNLQPIDLLDPIEMSERATGTTDLFDPMQQTEWSPEDFQQTELRYWFWTQETIQFLGATTSRDVKLHYLAGLTVPQNEGDSCGFINSIIYLAPKTAAYCKDSIVLGSGASLHAKAELALHDLINFNIKPRQDRPVRRLPYRRRRVGQALTLR